MSFVSILYPLILLVFFCVSFQFFIHTFLCVISFCWFDAVFVISSYVLVIYCFCCCSFVICQNSHILFGTLSFVSFTWYFVKLCCLLSFCHLSFRLLLFCHFDFYLVLEKWLNFFSRTLESASDPALDVEKTGDVLALVQVSPGFSSFISRKTFAEKMVWNWKNKIFFFCDYWIWKGSPVRRALNPLALTLPFETNLMVMNFFLDLKLFGLFLPQSQICKYELVVVWGYGCAPTSFFNWHPQYLEGVWYVLWSVWYLGW